MNMLNLILFLVIFVVLIAIIGKYLSNIINFKQYKGDKFFSKIDNCIYKICGISKEDMTFKQYAIALLMSNFIMFLIGFIILKIQGLIPLLNSEHVKGMSTSLSFNTAVSFITNTDLQHYSGVSAISNLSQMLVIIFLMFAAAATGCAIGAAFIRTVAGKSKSLGNFYMDFTRALTRVLIPGAFILAIILIATGVPQTLQGMITIKTIEGTFQNIAMGPIAALEAIKFLGTNGGGFFAANSATPFADPNLISNFIEMLAMTVIPGAFIVSFGMYYGNSLGNTLLQNLGLSKQLSGSTGQDLRFGNFGTSLFTTISTAFTTGATNSALNAANPIVIFMALWNMSLNTVFGGIGTGFMNVIMYVLLTVFICGLMVGRTPEFLGKKVEAREIKLIAIAILIHPILILFSTAFTLISGIGLHSGISLSFHGMSQVLYEFTSASANNGSLLGGFANSTGYWNILTAVIMLIARYAPILLLLAAGLSLANKRKVPNTVGTFKTDNAIFGVMLFCIILVIGALTFLPALGLGPITEFLKF